MLVSVVLFIGGVVMIDFFLMFLFDVESVEIDVNGLVIIKGEYDGNSKLMVNGKEVKMKDKMFVYKVKLFDEKM